MFVSNWRQEPPQERGLSRPFLIGLIVLLLFLTTSEFGQSPNANGGQGTPVTLGKESSPVSKLKDEVREKVRHLAGVTHARHAPGDARCTASHALAASMARHRMQELGSQ